MDNVNIQPGQSQSQPAAPQTPAPTILKPGSGEQNHTSNKMVFLFIIGIIVILALVGGIYFYLSKQQAASQPTVVTQTPAPTPQENLENDLNNINVDTATTSSDFAPVDQDLQQL